MKYIYIPNTYDKNKIKEKNLDDEIFIKLQLKYRESFERLLLKYLNISKIEYQLTHLDFEIPIINDRDYNFYHQSSLGSNYLFLRNNFHIENLDNRELEILNDAVMKNIIVSNEFLLSTYEKVLFEKNNTIFAGSVIPKNLVNGKSLIFEFAYDQRKCESIDQLLKIKNTIKLIFHNLQEELSTKIDLNISTVTYTAIPDIFKPK